MRSRAGTASGHVALALVLALVLAAGLGGCWRRVSADLGGVDACACAAQEFCQRPYGRCAARDGVCRPRPEACAQLYDPVCGCDGRSHSSACHANAAGVSVLHEGVCR